jgi:hypothetical protein
MNDPTFIPIFRNYIQGIDSLDILLVHEHKLRLPLIQEFGDKRWKQCVSWSLDASSRRQGQARSMVHP